MYDKNIFLSVFHQNYFLYFRQIDIKSTLSDGFTNVGDLASGAIHNMAAGIENSLQRQKEGHKKDEIELEKENMNLQDDDLKYSVLPLPEMVHYLFTKIFDG